MKYRDLTNKKAAELKEMVKEQKKELFLLQLKKGTAQLDKTHKLKAVRRDIARMLTRITELEKAQ